MRIAIQGERGSNSHMAALAMLADVRPLELVPCAVSAEVFEAVVAGRVEAAVLPIENSLHGSVAEHYDLLLAQPVRVERESLLRIRHNLIGAPGVRLADVRHVLSHPVALSQCRRFLAGFTQADALPFYDTAGSVKHLMAAGLRDTAGVAPELAAQEYGGEVLAAGIEDHAENYTRFYLLRSAVTALASAPPLMDDGTVHERGTRTRQNAATPLMEDGTVHERGTRQNARNEWATREVVANKMSVAFAVEHRPGTLVAALEQLRQAGADLTKIESRPVHGRPWEYVFYVDLRFDGEAMADAAVEALRGSCGMVKELGRYVEAESRQ
jgi:prephenate dehydratase